MFNKTFLTLAVTAGLSLPAFAGLNSVPLTDEEFQLVDYNVHVRNSDNESCGGLLVANQYVITASHCIKEEIPEEITSEKSLDRVVIDTSLYSLFATVGNKHVDDGKQIEAEWIESHPARDAPSESWQKQDSYSLALREEMKDLPYARFDEHRSANYTGDIAVFKLKEPYLQESVALLANENISFDASIDQSETIQNGWGATRKTGMTASTIGQVKMAYDLYRQWDDREEMTLHNFSCYDCLFFTPGPNDDISWSGDSGSPMLIDDKVVAFVSMGLGNGARERGTGAFQHLNWIAGLVDSVNTIGQINVDSTDSNAPGKQFRIPVQSLKVDDVFIQTELTDENNLWSLDSSDCDGVLQTGEYCHVTLTYNSNNQDVTSSSSGTLTLNEETIIPLNVTVPVVEQPPQNPDDDNEGGSSGGGSFGYGLIALLLGFRRLTRS